MARPTKKNPLGKQKKPKRESPDVIAKLKEAFSYDSPDVEACYYANISIDTLRRLREDSPELSIEFDRLRNQPTFHARRCVVNNSKKDPELALKYLERKRKKEFSPRHELTGEDGKDIFSSLTDVLTKKIEQKKEIPD